MTTRDEAREWVERYLQAWSSNDPDDIRGLFTEDAVYNGRPHDPEAWRGRDDIVAGWLDHRDEPGMWTFSFEVAGIVDERAVIRGVTNYVDDVDYDNLWILRLSGDRAVDFTEWFYPRKP